MSSVNFRDSYLYGLSSSTEEKADARKKEQAELIQLMKKSVLAANPVIEQSKKVAVTVDAALQQNIALLSEHMKTAIFDRNLDLVKEVLDLGLPADTRLECNPTNGRYGGGEIIIWMIEVFKKSADDSSATNWPEGIKLIAPLVDLNKLDSRYTLPLSRAIVNRDMDTVLTLVEYGASLDVSEALGRTPRKRLQEWLDECNSSNGLSETHLKLKILLLPLV